jgi:heptosyltransferase-2
MRYAVVQTAFLGDVILTVPLLGLLRDDPRVTEVAVVASPPGVGFLEEQDVVERVICYEKRGSDSGLAGLVRVVRDVRAFRADVALVPHRSFRSALIAAAAGIPVRVGFDVSGGRFLLTERRPYSAGTHEVERLASLFRSEGGRVPFRLRVPEGGRAELARRLAARSESLPGRYVLVAPGSRWATKRWLPDRFAEAAERIADSITARVVVVGADYEREVGAKVAAAVTASSGVADAASAALDLTGAIPLGPLAALVSGAELVLSNDSAVAHIAAGLGVPVVSVFGPTVPAQGFSPYTDRARIVETEVSCRPCGKHGGDRCPTGTFECMERVPVDDVVSAALGLLGHGGDDA